MNNEVENHGGSTETSTNEEPKKGWRKVLEGIASWLSYENKNKWLKDMRGNLGLIATVIATMTFQMALNPPGGVWSMKDDDNLKTINANSPSANANPPYHPLDDKFARFCTDINGGYLCPGEAVLAVVYDSAYFHFLVSNTICFIASLSVCLLLVSGISLNHRFLMWLLSVGMWVTLTSLAYSYIIAAEMTTPNTVYGKAFEVFAKVILMWIGLSAFIGLCHTLRLVTWGVKFYRKKNKNIPKTQKSTKETPIC